MKKNVKALDGHRRERFEAAQLFSTLMVRTNKCLQGIKSVGTAHAKSLMYKAPRGAPKSVGHLHSGNDCNAVQAMEGTYVQCLQQKTLAVALRLCYS